MMRRLSDYRPLVGGSKRNEIVADLRVTEHEEKDTLLIMQDYIMTLSTKTDNPKTQRQLLELSNAAGRLMASKIRRIELLCELLAMREREE